MFGIVDAFSNWNKVDAINSTISESKNKDVSLEKVIFSDKYYEKQLINDDCLEKLKSRYDDIFIKEVVGTSFDDEYLFYSFYQE